MRYRIKLRCSTCLGETYKKVRDDTITEIPAPAWPESAEGSEPTPAEQQAMADELAQHTAGHGPLVLLRRDPL